MAILITDESGETSPPGGKSKGTFLSDSGYQRNSHLQFIIDRLHRTATGKQISKDRHLELIINRLYRTVTSGSGMSLR